MLKSVRPRFLQKKNQKERPKKKRVKKVRRRLEFRDTRLGWLILKESPVLYSIITGTRKLPTKDMLRSLALNSDEPFFKTDTFWSELANYRPRTRWEPSAKQELERIKSGVFSERAIKSLCNSNSSL